MSVLVAITKVKPLLEGEKARCMWDTLDGGTDDEPMLGRCEGQAAFTAEFVMSAGEKSIVIAATALCIVHTDLFCTEGVVH